MALFNVLISPLNAFPWVINGLMEAWVSVKRVQAYLSLPELDISHYFVMDNMSDFGSEALVVRNGRFSWGAQDHQIIEHASGTCPLEWSLVDINISISPVSVCVLYVYVCVLCVCVWCRWYAFGLEVCVLCVECVWCV